MRELTPFLSLAPQSSSFKNYNHYMGRCILSPQYLTQNILMYYEITHMYNEITIDSLAVGDTVHH